MPQYRRLCVAAAMLCCLVCWLPAFGEPPSLLDLKQSVVSETLARFNGSSPAPATIQRAARADALLDIRSEGAPKAPILNVRVTGSPDCRVFDLDHGKRLVFDFSNTINIHETPGFVPLRSGLLRAVRTSLFAVDPDFVSRIVLDLSTAAEYSVTREPNFIRVSLTPNSDSLSPLQILVHLQQAFSPSSESSLDSLMGDLTSVRDSANTIASPAPQAEDAGNDRLALLTADIRAVSDFSLASSLPDFSLDAAVDTPETQPAAEQPAPEQPAETPAETPAPAPPPEPEAAAPVAEEEQPVEPPEKREENREETLKSNSALVGRMRSLLSGITPAEGVPEAAPEIVPIPLPIPEEPQKPSQPAYKGDPLQQLVDVDFRDTELVDVVALLAHKAGINVIAGSEVSGTVTANLHNVPLLQAMQTVLRMNDLGVVEEEGIFRIVPYEDAIRAQRTTEMIALENGKAVEVRKVLEDVKKGMPDERLISITANETANTIIIAGPKTRVPELVTMAHQLDVAEPVLPTITEPIKLNYAEPASLVDMVQKMLTPQIGQVAADTRARHLIVTDVPVVVEQVRELISRLDIAVKQVVIETMIVDVSLGDDAETGVDWLLQSIKHQNTRQAALGENGRAVGSLQDLSMGSNLSIGDAAGLLSYSLLTDDIDWTGVVQAEIRNRNGRLVSNPVLVTVENKPARISIAQEIPYVELSQTSQGGSQTSTQFKDVGTILTVTPAVTHDDHIIVELEGKESLNSGTFNDIPIEDKREFSSSLLMKSGQTIFVGGLRKNSNTKTIRKIPILGDIPVMGFAFTSRNHAEQANELIVFLTCSVLQEEMPDLTPYQQIQFDKASGEKMEVDAQRSAFHDIVHPEDTRDPAWKWRRSN